MPEFMVKVVLSDAKAAQVQDFAAAFRVSTENALAAAVMVGLTNWAGMDGQMIVHPAGRSGDNDLQLPRGWRRFRVALDLNNEQSDRVDEAAEWFDQSLTEFLGDCLHNGIAHAQSKMLEEQEAASGDGNDLSDDEDLPF